MNNNTPQTANGQVPENSEGNTVKGWWVPSLADPLPPAPGQSNASDYEMYFLEHIRDIETSKQIDKDIEDAPAKSVMDWVKKALSPPPSAFSYARISTMPDYYNRGVIQWPGLPPTSLKKIARENLAPIVIIGMRTDDILRYASLSRRSEPWKPGWSITLEDSTMDTDRSIRNDIKEAESFILNCNVENKSYIPREESGYTAFRTFLGALTRDSLTFDGMAIFTDRDNRGRIKAFTALSAQNIRLTAPTSGFDGDKSIFAVGMDEAGNIKDYFTRHDLIWHVRNARPDPDAAGYGYPEIEQSVRLIQGFQNSIDYNIDSFNRSSVPNGMFVFYGSGWVRRTLDYLARLMTNAKRGITKSWTLPFLVAPADGKVEMIDFSRIKGSEAYYQDFINMMIGACCSVFRFPSSRLGYRISGRGPDTVFNLKDTGITAQDEADPGREPLLGHLEHVMDIIVKSRWPHLKFQFHGKSPKEDAREYEMRMMSMTQDERRKAVGLPSLEKSLSKEEQKDEMMVKLMRIMGKAPVDSGQAGIYQNLAVAAMGGKSGGSSGGGNPEAMFPGKQDPALSEDHGHMSGVRRRSKKEEATQPGKQKKQGLTRPKTQQGVDIQNMRNS